MYFPGTPRSSKRKSSDGQLSEILNVTKRFAANLEKKQNDSNKTFVEYVYSRLSEMSAEEAKEKRKEILLIIED